jgi:hypothetical protein
MGKLKDAVNVLTEGVVQRDISDICHNDRVMGGPNVPEFAPICNAGIRYHE